MTMPHIEPADAPHPPLRSATSDDIDDVARLWCDAFPGRRTLEDRRRMLRTGGRYGGLETVLVARDGERRLQGACKIYQLEQHVAGAWMPMMGLAAVAVAPAFRRRGLGAHLCTGAIRRAAERGDVVSVLYPFRPDYYDRLGWGLAGRLHRHRSRAEWLPADAASGAVRTATSADAAAIAECYQRVADRSNGPIARDERVWAYRLTGAEMGVRPVEESEVWDQGGNPGREILVHTHDDGITGYAIVRYRRAARRQDDAMLVRELVAETETAYRGLLSHLARKADRWPLVQHFARPEERFGDRLRDPRPPRHRAARSLYFPTARIVRGPMLRVLDVPDALRRRGWFLGAPDRRRELSLRIEVTDPQRRENEGPWRVQLAADRPGAELERSAARADAELATDASAFGRIFAGDLSPTDAVRIGRATCTGAVGHLDDAFSPAQGFWLLDEF